MEIPEDREAAITIATNPERLLSERERAALEVTRERRPRPPLLSPVLETQLFTMYLNGIDCLEIARLNPGLTLGQIVLSRVENRWDMKRQEHVESLLKEARSRLEQTTLESVDFLNVQLAAAHRVYGDKVKKYMQTGNPEDLGDFAITGWKSYRDAVDLLKTMTGQDGKQKISGEITHKHEVSAALTRAPTPEEARSIIEAELKARKK